jgi:hypothetical protein
MIKNLLDFFNIYCDVYCHSAKSQIRIQLVYEVTSWTKQYSSMGKLNQHTYSLEDYYLDFYFTWEE